MSRLKFLNIKTVLTVLSLVSILVITGCGSGSDGAAGPAGPTGATGPTGPTGPGAATEITETMSAEFTGATVAADGSLTVNFTLATDVGAPFIGLTSNQVRFTLAQLIPAGAINAGDASKWQSYINKVESAPTDPANGPGTVDAVQATYERDGTFTDNGDGSYSYTFNVNLQSVTSPVAVAYNADYTHRVAFQISGSGFPTMNPTYDWQPSSGATDGIYSRSMVIEETCNACHGELAIHGGGRIDTGYCVTCHNPGSNDANSGNTVDMTVMVHKIHRGANLPSVKAGGNYTIWGYRDGEHDYSETSLPQDIRNCTSCHDDALAATPDAANWNNTPTIEACGSCHDDVDFALGQAGGHEGGVFIDNADCSTCHRQEGFSSIEDKHLGVMEQIETTRSKFTAVAQAIRVDQGTGDVEVDVMLTLDGVPVVALRDGSDVDTDVGAVLGKYGHGTDNGALAINWDNGEGYQYTHKEIVLNDCVADGAGLFTCSEAGLLLGVTDTDVITATTVDILLCMNEKDGEIVRCDSAETSINLVTEVAVTPTPVFFNGDNTITTDGYDKFGADIDACEGCHRDKIYHHASTELMQCKTCHNSSRVSYRGGPGDLKYNVHKLHSGLDTDPAQSETDDTVVEHYPNDISDCAACHTESQIDLPIQVNDRASVTNRASAYISPTAVVCSSCHVSSNLGAIDLDNDPNLTDFMSTFPPYEQAVLDHMIQNGAIFGGDEISAGKVESCAICHAKGQEYGVDVVHN